MTDADTSMSEQSNSGTSDVFSNAPGSVTGSEVAPVGGPHEPAGASSSNPFLNDPDPSIRNAARMLEAQKAEQQAYKAVPRQPQTDVDPVVRLQQIAFAETHDYVAFEGLDMAKEREAILASIEQQPQQVRQFSTEAARQMIEATDGGAELAAEWGDQFNEKAATAKVGATAVLNELGGLHSEATAHFLHGFYNLLPGSARMAVTRELSENGISEVEPVSAGMLDLYADNPVGKALVKEWGPQAATNIAKVKARSQRLLGAMSPGDANATLDWIDRLTYDQVKAIARHFAR